MCLARIFFFGLIKTTLRFVAFSYTTQNAKFLNFDMSQKFFGHY